MSNETRRSNVRSGGDARAQRDQCGGSSMSGAAGAAERQQLQQQHRHANGAAANAAPMDRKAFAAL